MSKQHLEKEVEEAEEAASEANPEVDSEAAKEAVLEEAEVASVEALDKVLMIVICLAILEEEAASEDEVNQEEKEVDINQEVEWKPEEVTTVVTETLDTQEEVVIM